MRPISREEKPMTTELAGGSFDLAARGVRLFVGMRPNPRLPRESDHTT